MRTNMYWACLLLAAAACQTDPASEVEPTSPSGKGGGGGNKAYLVGDPADVQTTTQQGLVLMGGSTDVDEAMRWMLERSGGGDIIVLRASGSDGYNSYLYNLSNVNSVETLIIDSRRKAEDTSIEQKVRNAEAVFIAGGDQNSYVSNWKGTRLQNALNYLANTKKVTIGGTSAGLAILGEYYYAASSGTVYSYEALEDPYNRYMDGLGGGFLQMPFMANTITDTHYNERDRQGRHFAFMARLVKDFNVYYADVRGIGVDERTAACIDHTGQARVFGSGAAYFIQGWGGSPENCTSGNPLTWYRARQAVDVYRLPGNTNGSNTFSLANWSTGSGGSWQYWWSDQGVFQMQ